MATSPEVTVVTLVVITPTPQEIANLTKIAVAINERKLGAASISSSTFHVDYTND